MDRHDNDSRSVPPHPPPVEAERALIGAALLDNRVLTAVRLQADAFTTDLCRRVWAAAGRLVRADKVADLVTVTASDASLAPADVAALTTAVPSAANAGYYAELVRDGLLRRKLDQVGATIAGANGSTGTELFARVRGQLTQLEGLAAPTARPQSAVLRCLADVEAEVPRWLWPAMIPAGRLTLVVGDPGNSKSLLICDLAARLSCGTSWPDGAGGGQPSDVLILAAEDSPGDYRYRLDGAGADVGRCHVLEALRTADETRPVTLADVDAIHDAVEQLERQDRAVSLIALDTVGALLAAGVDDTSHADVRTMLRPLAALAESTGAAVVGITHLRKMAGSALHRTLGTVGWTAAARAVLVVARDREDRTRRLLAVAKSNYSAEPNEGALAYSVVSDSAGRPQLAWAADRVDIDADSALATSNGPHGANAGESASTAAKARDWLRASLAMGPVAKAALVRVGKEEGFSLRTLERAAADVPVVATRDGFPARSIWSLGDQFRQESPVPPHENAGGTGKSGGTGEDRNSASV